MTKSLLVSTKNPIIALVYLGKNLPDYVNANLEYLSKVFQHDQIVFISDSTEVLKTVTTPRIHKWQYVLSDLDYEKALNSLKHPKEFRNGFWKKVIERFFALEKFQTDNPHPLLYFESDIWVSPHFPIEKFVNLDRIAFPLESSNTAAASTLFLPNLNSTRKLTSFIIDRIIEKPTSTDMTILKEFWDKHRDEVMILPTNIPHRLPPNEVEYTFEASHLNFDFFESIFDSVTYGLYFIGEDPRNHRGLIKLRNKPIGHLSDVERSGLKIDRSDLCLEYQSQKYRINSLHIHTKEKAIFRHPTEFLKKRVFRKRNKFVSFIFFSLLLKKFFG